MSRAEPPPLPSRPQVLLAEDNPVNAMVLSQQLATLGYSCTVAENGELAWSLLQSGDFVALLTDCEMPVLDGYSLATRVRATQAHAHLKVIALSARPGAAQQARCHAAGMDACLSKPVSNQALSYALATTRKAASEAADENCVDALRLLYPDPRAMATVLTLFLDTCLTDIPEMERSYLRAAPQPFGRVAHRLVGSLQLLDQKDLAGELSHWYRNGALPSPSEYARLRRQLLAFVDQVRAGVQRLEDSS